MYGEENGMIVTAHHNRGSVHTGRERNVVTDDIVDIRQRWIALQSIVGLVISYHFFNTD